MSTETPPPSDPRDRSTRALGDLLYPDAATPPVSEKEWVGVLEAVAAGDVHALHALYERTHHLVFTLAIRMTNSQDTAEEITLDVFNHVWQRASTYDPAAASVVGWIMNQARSRALDRLRLEHTEKPVRHVRDISHPPAGATEVDEAVSLRIQGRLLREALTVLAPEERQAIETIFFSELTSREGVARLDEAPETIKTHVRSGLRKLGQALAKTVKGR